MFTRNALRVFSLLVLPAAGLAQKNITGEWGSVIAWPHIPVHVGQLTDGRLVTWSSTQPTTFPAGQTFTYAAIYDPASGQIASLANTKHDMFCSGLATTGDGRFVISGGGTDVRTTTLMGASSRWGQNWVQVGNMAQGRWYNSSVTLKDGNVMTLWGRGANGVPEVFNAATNLWSTLTGINISSAADPNDNVDDANQWYPHIYLAPNGQVFMAGPLKTLRYLNPAGAGSSTDVGSRGPDVNRHRKLGSSVLFRPGRILFTGGRDDRYSPSVWNTSVIIDIRNGAPVTTTAANMNYARAFHHSVMLPNGEVFVAGGNTSGQKFSDNGAVLIPEIWNPDTNQWRTLPAMAEARTYHSVAALMRDGRVMLAGGGLCGCGADHQNGQIYSPGYLFTAAGAAAPRPTIASVPVELKAGLSVSLSGSDDITGFSMVRLQAITHGLNSDQRWLPVNFNKTAAGQYTLNLEASDNILAPGLYWIFALNGAGTPSIGYPVQVYTAATWPGLGGMPQNLARGKAATQSSTNGGAAAARAVDGNQNGSYDLNSVSHTNLDANAWWQVDLGAVSSLREIRLWNRTDCCADRLSNFHVLVSDVPFVSNSLDEVRAQAGVTDLTFTGVAGQSVSFNLNRSARYVRVQLEGSNFLHLAEVEVLGLPIANRPPVVTLTSPAADATFDPPATINLTAEASDPDNNLARVEFYNGAVKLGEATSAPYGFTWTNVAEGTYSLSARAIDSAGLTATSAVSITVQGTNRAPTVTLTSPAANATFTAPATVTFAATAADADNNLARVEFYNGATKLGEDSTAPFTFNWTNVAAGTYTVSARAVDSEGLSATSGVSITVQPANRPPTVAVTSPAANATFLAPASITIAATAADPDNNLARVEFYNGAAKIGEDTSAPYSFIWSNVPVGTYSLSARAVDAGGLSASSAVNVSVTLGNQAPSVAITSPTANVTYTAPASIAIAANASDPENAITRVEFFNGTTKIGEDTTAPYGFTWANVAAGTYTIQTRVTDGGGLTANASVNVTVTPPTGGATGLTGDYFNTTTFTNLLYSRTDATVNFAWGSAGPGGGISATAYSVRWSGKIEGPYTGQVTLCANANDGMRVTVGTTLVVDNYWTKSNAASTCGVYSMQLGTRYDISIDYFNSGTGSAAQFRWWYPGGAFDIVPTRYLTPRGSAGNSAPSVTLTSPIANASFNAPASITIAANVVDPDNNVGRVEFFNGATKLGEDTTAPYSFTWTNVATGTYTIQARATDAGGLTGTAQVSISVVTPPPSGTTGLRGEYFESLDFTTSRFSRIDPAVDFNWGTASPGAGLTGNRYSVRWTGKIEASATAQYVFCGVSDDGIKVWVDNQVVADGYYERTASSSCGTINLVAGRKYDIKVEYFNNAGPGASIQLKWWYAGGAFEVVPTRYLSPQ